MLLETRSDAKTLLKRQRDIDIGKNTVGYGRYLASIARSARVPLQHPATPKKHRACSTRSWEGQVKKWRRWLHAFDPENYRVLARESVEALEAECKSAPVSPPPSASTVISFDDLIEPLEQMR